MIRTALVVRRALAFVADALGVVLGAAVVGLAIMVPAGIVGGLVALVASIWADGSQEDLFLPCFAATWGVMWVAFLAHWAWSSRWG